MDSPSSPTRTVSFENCRVPTANVVGKRGDGMRIALSALDAGRLNIASTSIGGAARCLGLA